MHHINAPEVLLLDMSLKGIWHEIFDFGFFFMNQFPQGPWVSLRGHFEFLRKFAEIFATIDGVNDTCDKLSPASMLLDINYCRCCWHPVMRPCPGFSSIPSFPWYQRLINRRTPAMKHWQNTSLTFSKNHYMSMNTEQQPKSISKKFEKLPISKCFSFIAVTIRNGPNGILRGPRENDS